MSAERMAGGLPLVEKTPAWLDQRAESLEEEAAKFRAWQSASRQDMEAHELQALGAEKDAREARQAAAYLRG
ncbi:MAG: hypothetical protein ACRDMV_03915, partial [Streptosporangiales bacterium]